MVALSVLYLGGTIAQWYFLSVESFHEIKHKETWSDEYVEELFTYAKEIEEVKVMHAVGMLFIAALICAMVVRKKLLSKKAYSRLLCLSCVITMLYFFPLIAIGYKTYDLRGPDAERSAKILADWFYILLKNNDTNVVGLGFSCLVHG